MAQSPGDGTTIGVQILQFRVCTQAAQVILLLAMAMLPSADSATEKMFRRAILTVNARRFTVCLHHHSFAALPGTGSAIARFAQPPASRTLEPR